MWYFLVLTAEPARKKLQNLSSVEFIDCRHPVAYVEFFVNVVNMFSYCLRAKE